MIPKIKRDFAKGASKSMEKDIIGKIGAGLSPVRGKGSYKKYSTSYREGIKSGRYGNKRVRPVNLKLSGALHKSFFLKILKDKLIVGFGNKLADIHNRLGAGKSKTVRRMLPTKKGETFTADIMQGLVDELQKAVRKAIKKFR